LLFCFNIFTIQSLRRRSCRRLPDITVLKERERLGELPTSSRTYEKRRGGCCRPFVNSRGPDLLGHWKKRLRGAGELD
jgi:hypothetical protein